MTQLPRMAQIISLLPLFLMASVSHAAGDTYTCSIQNLSKLSDNGFFVRHGWTANYMDREFTVERETGKVLRTTALKERLNNFDKQHAPVLVNAENRELPYVAFTFFEDSGRYALLEINDTLEYQDIKEKPYLYITYIGMIMSGTCILNEK